MRWGIAILGGVAALCAAAPTLAQNRSFCAERPGMASPVCTLSQGQAMIEVTVLGLDRTVAPAFDLTIHSFADTLVRYGVDNDTELQVGLTGHVQVAARERASGAVARADGTGDSYFAVRRSLPGFAVEGYVTLPTGSKAVSAGTWGAGLVVPIDLLSPENAQFSFTPEIGLAPDADGVGRHLAYGAVLGVAGELAPGWGGGLEIWAGHDDEPTDPSFGSLLVGTLAWQASNRLQLNAELGVAIVSAAPRTTALLGFALRL